MHHSLELMADPTAWLRAEGFDPVGDLCEPIQSKSRPWAKCTAMWVAAFAGELGACQWLMDNGASSTLRVKDGMGMTPMFAACEEDHIEVARWLFEAGAAEDIRTRNNFGMSPMWVACRGSRRNHCLRVAKWLYAAGAAPDARTQDNNGETPMHVACENGHSDVVKWLVTKAGAADDMFTKDNVGRTPMMATLIGGHAELAAWLVIRGAANSDYNFGHVDGASLAAYVRAELRPGLCACLRLQLAEHAAFASIVLPAVSVDLEASSGASGASSASATGWGGAASTPRPLSQLLRGHEETLLALIADFAGVVRGRQLRNAREALTFLDG